MTKHSLSILVLIFLASCGMDSNQLVVKNESGQITAKYSIDKDSIRNGSFETFYDDGQIKESGQYKNGQLDGLRKLYFPNGKVELEENYQEGNFDGPYKTYYENGQVNVEGVYSQNLLNGTVKRYYDSGELMEEVAFQDNEENGPFKEYYKNGQLKWQGGYLNGDNEFGLLIHFAENGDTIKKMECDSNAICQTIWTAEEGEVTKKYVPINE